MQRARAGFGSGLATMAAVLPTDAVPCKYMCLPDMYMYPALGIVHDSAKQGSRGWAHGLESASSGVSCTYQVVPSISQHLPSQTVRSPEPVESISLRLLLVLLEPRR